MSGRSSLSCCKMSLGVENETEQQQVLQVKHQNPVSNAVIELIKVETDSPTSPPPLAWWPRRHGLGASIFARSDHPASLLENPLPDPSLVVYFHHGRRAWQRNPSTRRCSQVLHTAQTWHHTIIHHSGNTQATHTMYMAADTSF